jgi:TrmH family RNA methyltransferase
MKTRRKEALRAPEARPRRLPHVIDSPNHGLIHWVRALRQRPERDKRGQFIVEGWRLVSRALDEPSPPELLLYTHPVAPASFSAHLLGKARRKGAKCQPVTAKILADLAHHEDPQGVLAVVPSPIQVLAVQSAPPPRSVWNCWLALEAVRNPGNLGTILRTVEAVGAAGVITLGNEVDFLDPAVVRASMGGIFGPRLVRATWSELSAWKSSAGMDWLATSPQASVDYVTADYSRPMVIWIGEERRGLSDEVLRSCDQQLRIPMAGRADSLNMALSAGLLLYEARRHYDVVCPEISVSPGPFSR